MSVACFLVPSSFEEVGDELYMCAFCELYILRTGMEKQHLGDYLVLNHYLNCIRRFWSLVKKGKQ